MKRERRERAYILYKASDQGCTYIAEVYDNQRLSIWMKDSKHD